jgi:hypothetical protein
LPDATRHDAFSSKAGVQWFKELAGCSRGKIIDRFVAPLYRNKHSQISSGTTDLSRCVIPIMMKSIFVSSLTGYESFKSFE